MHHTVSLEGDVTPGWQRVQHLGVGDTLRRAVQHRQQPWQEHLRIIRVVHHLQFKMLCWDCPTSSPPLTGSWQPKYGKHACLQLSCTLTMLSMMMAVFRTTGAFSRSPFTSSGTRIERHGDSTACKQRIKL